MLINAKRQGLEEIENIISFLNFIKDIFLYSIKDIFLYSIKNIFLYFIKNIFLYIIKNIFSSCLAESARAVTGRRCPHSGEGEDFLKVN